jgi:signal transduction histidine kinase
MAPIARPAAGRAGFRDVDRALVRRVALLVAVPLLALPAGLAAAIVTLTSSRVDHPTVRAFLTVLGAWAFVAGGLTAWSTRPGNRTGPLMVLTGFLLLAGSLTASDAALPFTLGQLTAPAAEAVFVHLLLAFPDGRLHARLDRAVVVLAYLLTTVGQWTMLLFMDYRSARGCPCPQNLLFVVHNDGVHEILMGAQRVVAAAVVVGVVVALANHWRSASPPLRRTLAPVLSTGALTAVLAGLANASAQSNQTAATWFGLATSLALAFVPLGFLVGLLRSRLARAAVGDLVIELGRTMAPGELRGALARALGDPSLELAYRLPDSDTYVDLAGQRYELPAEGSARAVTFVERGGRRIAAVVHDAALKENSALVDAACAAAGLALENERLQAELRARLDDLQASRARIVMAGDTERRRLERNLHDGAQQRIVSVSFALGLAEARLPGDPDGARDIVAAARQELSQALEELRELARGIHPAILTSRGLGGALEALAMTAPVPIELAVQADRLPGPVEAAAYYLVAEAVTNATKYAHAHSVSVAVSRDDGYVTVVVSDDGIGGADPSAGSGLRGLADRVEALAGRLSMSSPVGRGTTIEASIPCG